MKAVLVFFTLIWPFIAAWLMLKLFPSGITKFVEKEIERRSDAKLEVIKAEIQSSYSTLKTSVDLLATSNSAMHPHIIEAVSLLWSNIVEMRRKFGKIILFDSIVLANEAKDSFSQEQHDGFLEIVRIFDDEDKNDEISKKFLLTDLEKKRLFCGDRLWLVFYIFRATLMRSIFLISLSFKTRQYQDWRKDDRIRQFLENVLPKDKVKQVRESQLGGLAAALDSLEAEFLHEATRVMSGSKAMSDSLADVHALMLLQNARVAERDRHS